jgi:DNA gyrase subunit B
MSNKNSYNEDSIVSLSPRDFTRLRPGVYVGSTEYSTQLLIEIVSNAVDEYKAGNGDNIDVMINDKNVISVLDNGQGFLVNSLREDGKTVLEASFSVLNTSGKYTDDGVYEGTALGLNGIGSKLATYLSHSLYVETHRDGEMEAINFVEGEFSNRKVGKLKDLDFAHGTLVRWEPSEEFFTHVEVDIDVIKKLFRVLVCLCPGLRINLDNKGESTTYYSKNGLNDLVDDSVKDKELIKNRFNFNYANGKYQMNMVLTYTDNYSATFIPYVNTGLTDSGPHLTQIKTILTREFNKFFREKKWIKEKEDNLSGDDIQEGMFSVFNITAPGVSYDAQTKSRIVKIDMSSFTSELANSLQVWFKSNEKEVKIIADKALAARKAREAAKKARDAARGQQEKKKKALKFASKLADCNSSNRSECEIYITEGDSATGGLKLGRDEKFQAVMPVRGKILNCQKATLAQIQKNAEIMTMIEAFGLTIDTKTMKVTYDKKDLRYGKIIIMSDADVDGAHIKNLFYTFIWNFCPDLIKDGYIYAGVPPLFKVTEGNGKSYKYLKDQAALDEYKASHTGKYVVGRMKGLGEMDPEEVAETLMDPENRIIHQIRVEDEVKASTLFEQMMGSSPTPRKKFLKDYSEESYYVE